MIDIMRLLQLAAFLTLVAPLSARADFQIGAPTPRPTPEAPSEPAPLPPVPKFKTATGYGNNVPLDFAARQIVPMSVRLRFAANVDRDALVTWRGNAPWNHVLTAALRPLGLRVLIGATEVTILR